MTNSKKIKIVISIVIGLIALYKQYSSGSESTNPTTNTSTTHTAEEIIKSNATFNYLPTSTTGQIVRHNGYNLSYSEPHEQAEWVAYTLSKSDIQQINE